MAVPGQPGRPSRHLGTGQAAHAHRLRSTAERRPAKALIRQNTQQFLDGKPANNVLLTGSRGTGKSSLVKACLNEFHSRGLKLVEIDKENIGDLPEVIEIVSHQPGYFILFCDDLSFEEGDIGYKRLKTALTVRWPSIRRTC